MARAATEQHTITRGPRKGKTITRYVNSKAEVRAGDVPTGATGTNRQKGNPRADWKFDEAIDAKGRKVRNYTDPKTGKRVRIVIRGKRHEAVKSTKGVNTRNGKQLTVSQREAAVKTQPKPKPRTGTASQPKPKKAAQARKRQTSNTNRKASSSKRKSTTGKKQR